MLSDFRLATDYWGYQWHGPSLHTYTVSTASHGTYQDWPHATVFPSHSQFQLTDNSNCKSRQVIFKAIPKIQILVRGVDTSCCYQKTAWLLCLLTGDFTPRIILPWFGEFIFWQRYCKSILDWYVQPLGPRQAASILPDLTFSFCCIM